MKNIYKALAGFQEEVPVIHEDTKGYNYTYSNINTIFEVIKPLLKKHGLAFYQSLQADMLETVLFHIESGEEINSAIIIPSVKLGSMNEYQSLGSGITYLRRYSLSCILGLITDKDIDAKGEQKPTIRKALKVGSKEWDNALKGHPSIDALEQVYQLTEEVKKEYTKQTINK